MKKINTDAQIYEDFRCKTWGVMDVKAIIAFMQSAEMKEGMLSFWSTHSMNHFDEKQDPPKKKEENKFHLS